MVASPLVETRIAEGERLLRAADREGLEITAAFWIFREEDPYWRLVIATPKAEGLAKRAVYRTIQGLLEAEAISVDLAEVRVARPDEPIVRLVSRALRTGPGIAGVRFTANAIDGTFIDDAYIYRTT